MLKKSFSFLVSLVMIVSVFNSSVLANTEESNTEEIIEEVKNLIEQTEVLEITKENPIVKKFEEYTENKGEIFENTEEVYIGIKSNEIITVQFSNPAEGMELTMFEVQFDTARNEFLSVLKIQQNSSTKETKITDLATGNTEIVVEDNQGCEVCDEEQFAEIESEIAQMEEVVELQEQVDTIIDEQSSELQAAMCPSGTKPVTKCKTVPAFSVTKYLACMAAIKKHKVCRSIGSYSKKTCTVDCYPVNYT